MAKYERVKDKWATLRKEMNLYGNSELEVKLEAITMPLYKHGQLYSTHPSISYGSHTMEMHIDWGAVEELPALAAGVSYGSKDKLEGNHDRCIALNKKLIEQGHHMPLEIITAVWYISGIPKSASSQLRTHRLCGSVSSSKRYKTIQPSFVYPIFDYLDDEDQVKKYYKQIEEENKRAFEMYENLRAGGIKKEDARSILPVNFAAEKTWWCNIRELRHVFNLRLRADTEIHLRKAMWNIFDIIDPLLPSLFSDIKEQM